MSRRAEPALEGNAYLSFVVFLCVFVFRFTYKHLDVWTKKKHSSSYICLFSPSFGDVCLLYDTTTDFTELDDMRRLYRPLVAGSSTGPRPFVLLYFR